MVVRMRRYMMAGLLVWLPIGATILIFTLLLDLMDRLLFLIPLSYRPEELLGFRIPGLGAILALTVLTLTGMLVANFRGRRRVPARRFIQSVLPDFGKPARGPISNRR